MDGPRRSFRRRRRRRLLRGGLTASAARSLGTAVEPSSKVTNEDGGAGSGGWGPPGPGGNTPLPSPPQQDALAEDVHGLDPLLAARGPKHFPFLRKALAAGHVELVLVTEAAQQASAAAGDLRRVQREPLVLGQREADRLWIPAPRGAAILAPPPSPA